MLPEASCHPLEYSHVSQLPNKLREGNQTKNINWTRWCNFSFLHSLYCCLQNVHIDTFVEVAKQSIVDACNSAHPTQRHMFFPSNPFFLYCQLVFLQVRRCLFAQEFDCGRKSWLTAAISVSACVFSLRTLLFDSQVSSQRKRLTFGTWRFLPPTL